MARIECGMGCFLRKKGCKDMRKCACSCGELKAINSNLFDGCVDQCNSNDRPLNADDYKCRFVGGDILYSYHGILDCGFTPLQSTEFQTIEEQIILEEKAQKAQESGSPLKGIAIIILVLLIGVSSWFLLFKK